MTQTQKLIEVALAIVSNWDDGFPVHGDEQIADDFRTALDAAKQEHRAEPETALSYVRDMVLNDRGPLEGMGMTNDQTNAMLAIIDAAPVAAQPAPYERFPTEWLERKIAEGPDVDIGAAQPAPEVPSVPFGYVVDLHEGTGLPPNLQFYGPGERYGSGFSHTPVYSGEQVAAMLEQQAEPIGYVHPDTLGLLKNYTHCAMFRPGDQTEGSIALYTHPPVQQATQQVAEKGACPVCGCEELDHRGIWTCRCPAQQAAQPAPVAYQWRHLIGNPDVVEPFWTEWEPCSKGEFEYALAMPDFECRELVVRPFPPAQQANGFENAQDEEVVLEACTKEELVILARNLQRDLLDLNEEYMDLIEQNAKLFPLGTTPDKGQK